MKTLAEIIDGDPLVRLIDQVILEEHASEPPRHYLGASSIGEECSRKLWYRYNGHKENFDAETLRRFSDGHDTEAKIIRWLERCPGIEIHTRTDTGGQIGFERFAGAFSGHYDGVGRGFPQAPKTWHIVEIKCVNEKAFKELEKLKAQNEKTAIELWKPEYYSQVQVYMHMEKLTRSIHIVATPGGRNLISVRTEYDKDHALAMLAKAERIINAKTPPERIGDKTYFKCKFCSFREMCHETPPVSRNSSIFDA